MNAPQAFEAVTALSIQVALLVLVTLVWQRWLRDAQAAYRLWTLCFVLVLLLAVADWTLPHRRWGSLAAALSDPAAVRLAMAQSWLMVAGVGVWAIGIAVSLLRRGVLTVRLQAFLRDHCRPLTPDELARLNAAMPEPETVADATQRDRTWWAVSEHSAGPFCYQLHRPTIVLPRYLIEADATTLRHVVVHEWEHLRTAHPRQHFLQGLCSTLLWFHPAVWVAARSAGISREYWCDEVVATRCGRVSEYLRTLLKVAERCDATLCTDLTRHTLAFSPPKSSLVCRSERLVQLARRAPGADRSIVDRWRSTLAMASLVVVAAALSLVWLPTNPMASTRSDWSPWPSWTAAALHTLNVPVRDFETFDARSHWHERLIGQGR